VREIRKLESMTVGGLMSDTRLGRVDAKEERNNGMEGATAIS
jgi:hypothetical protein